MDDFMHVLAVVAAILYIVMLYSDYKKSMKQTQEFIAKLESKHV